MENQKKWWIPIWNGLVMDQGARHYQRMGNAIWLFLYLSVNAERKTGSLKRKIRTISLDMGIGRSTILRWMNTLKKQGYISTKSTGRYLSIVINKWKTGSGVQNTGYQKTQIWNFRGTKDETSENDTKRQNPLYSNPKSANSSCSNDTLINNILINNNVNRLLMINRFDPKNEQEALAIEIAKILDDEKNLGLYISFAKRYSRDLLLSVLNQVKQLPSAKIKKTRGALFTYLVKHYGQRQTTH